MYEKQIVSESIVCELCGGKHKVLNPNYDKENIDSNKYLICPYCNSKGRIEIEKIRKENKQLSEKIYIIKKITTFLSNSRDKYNREKNHQYLYYITSLPTEKGHYFNYAFEEDLVLEKNPYI